MPGPSNLYGAANPVALPVGTTVFGPIACPSSVETTIATSPALIAPSSGYFYPLVWLTVQTLNGATAPGGLVFAAKIGAGSDFDTFYVVPSGFYANQYMYFTGTMCGFASNTLWQAPGSVINMTANPTGQPITCYNMKYMIALFRAPDQ
jgi:hypothetical protein